MPQIFASSKRLAKIIDSLSDDLKRLRLPEVIEDYEATITAELDLRHEAANASLLKKNTSKRKLVYVPTVFWDYSSPRIMVSEKISGIPIGDIAALTEAGVNMKTLAERGVEIFSLRYSTTASFTPICIRAIFLSM